MSAVALNPIAENEESLAELIAAGPFQDYEELFHLIWDNSRDGLRLTNQAGVMVKVNDAFCRMVGLPSEELIGKPFDIIHGKGDTAPAVRQSRKRADSKGNILRVEKEFVLWNGERTWFEISNLTFEPADSGRMLLSVFRELGDRKVPRI
jgi:PAS domain S-box-containing protein